MWEAVYIRKGVLIKDIVKTPDDERHFFDFENIRLTEHFGRSEKQLLETSLEFRESCLSYLSTKTETENLKHEREKAMSKSKESQNKLAKQYNQ